MGMFDSLYASREDVGYEREWQTKAFACELDRFDIGDEMPEVDGGYRSYQVEILGARHSLATVRDGALVAVDAFRDHALPLISYGGGIVQMPGPCPCG